MIKYQVWCGEIKAIVIARETDDSVFIPRPNGKEKRKAKRTDGGGWFDTFEEAKAFLVHRALRELTAARVRLDRAKRQLKKMRELSETQPVTRY